MGFALTVFIIVACTIVWVLAGLLACFISGLIQRFGFADTSSEEEILLPLGVLGLAIILLAFIVYGSIKLLVLTAESGLVTRVGRYMGNLGRGSKMRVHIEKLYKHAFVVFPALVLWTYPGVKVLVFSWGTRSLSLIFEKSKDLK